MDNETMAARLVESLCRPDGDRARRPVHTNGNAATGHFRPSKDAARFCKAEVFSREEVPVTVRWSNGSGMAARKDGWSDIRGMATRFHLLDGTGADLVAMTLREFFTPTPQGLLDFTAMTVPKPCKPAPWWRKVLDYASLLQPVPDPYPGQDTRPDDGAIAFADTHPDSQLGIMEASTIGAPVSYARAAYHAVHTFIVTAPDGETHPVRFTWQPTIGVLNTNPYAGPPVDDYLEAEMRERLGRGPVSYMLMMVLGEVGDDYADCTRAWPPHRRRVFMGTMTIDTPLDDEVSEKLSYNPWFEVEGVTPSDDPILQVRREAYAHSGRIRGANVCPFKAAAREDAA